jgi:Xaa-Pro aminopeptidase
VHRLGGDPEWLSKLLVDLEVKRVGFEGSDITFSQHQQIINSIQKLPIDSRPELVSTSNMIEKLRIIKEINELDSLQRAIDIGDQAFNTVGPNVEAGMTERQIAWDLEKVMRDLGADSVSFDLIVASGPNAALPHHRPSDRVIQEGEPVVIDMGARFDGYCSDLTRTICIGGENETFRRIYDTVLGAQLSAINTVTDGISGSDCDNLARSIIEEAGHGDNFGHSLGHGVGLAVHEPPTVGPRSEEILENGMVFTIEPGIYIPGWGGVRIEDIVILENGHARILSHARKLGVDHN